MRRTEYISMAERLLDHVENKTTESASDVYQVPVSCYLDEDLWHREMKNIFRRLPLMLAMTCEMRNTGDYKVMEVADFPVLMVRGKDGKVRAFLNACTHRGAFVAKEGKGNCSRFSCPYHAWTFNLEGDLIGVADPKKFGDVDKSTMGLTELPCDERAGLIFVMLDPNLTTDLDDYLGDMLPELESLGFANWEKYAQNELDSANWKLTHDGYVEGYHFQATHPETIFVNTMNNTMIFDAYGPHQRIGFPMHGIEELRDKPQDSWETQEKVSIVRTLFPNTSIAIGPTGGMISQLIPGTTPESSRTIQNHLMAKLPETKEEKAMADAGVETLKVAVRDEDYAMVFDIQKGISTGLNDDFVFGKNELGLHRWHSWVDYYAHDNPVAEAARPNP